MFCSDNEEFTLECCATNISIKNITFEQQGNDNEGIVSVKNGRVTFDDCYMRCETNGVTVESGELVMRQCKVHGAKVSQIKLFSFQSHNKVVMGNVSLYVVVQFYPRFKFYFPLLWVW